MASFDLKYTLGVGPVEFDTSFWTLNEERPCLRDDEFTFESDGSFSINLQEQTWIEQWQSGAEQEECGAPLPPFDGAGVYTYSYDGSALTLDGVGAYMVLPKPVNGAELGDPNDAPASVTYRAYEEDNSGELTLTIESGGPWWTMRLEKVADAPDAGDSEAIVDWSVVDDADKGSVISATHREALPLRIRFSEPLDVAPYSEGRLLIDIKVEPVENQTEWANFTFGVNESTSTRYIGDAIDNWITVSIPVADFNLTSSQVSQLSVSTPYSSDQYEVSYLLGDIRFEADVTEVDGANRIYRRDWELLSATDTNDDGEYDRLYVIETASMLDLQDATFCTDNPDECDGDRPRFNHFDRINFYERMPGFDYLDVDADGVNNRDDVAPYDLNESIDSDGDGVGDSRDQYPNDPLEAFDTDGDGIGNNADDDDDGDGVVDEEDAFPLDATESSDLDGDGIGDNADFDRDGDGVRDEEDAFPDDATESRDSDNDGIGDVRDLDDDNDGVRDYLDAFPLNPDESTDTDGDGIGNNEDGDDDGDGIPDDEDPTPTGDAVLSPILNDDGVPTELAALLLGESEQLSLFLEAPSGLDDPKLPTGRMTFIYDLKGDGTFQRKSQGAGDVYGTWAWDGIEGALTLAETTATGRNFSLDLNDPDLTGNLDIARFVDYQNTMGNGFTNMRCSIRFVCSSNGDSRLAIG